MPKVFLSYSRSDLQVAQSLSKALQAYGVEVWRDEESLRGGELWPKLIGDAIAAQDAIVLLWSAHSANSHYVEQEWNAAFAKKKVIIPCLLDDADLPQMLSQINSIPSQNLSTALPSILKAIPTLEENKVEIARQTNTIKRLKQWLIACSVIIFAMIATLAYYHIRYKKEKEALLSLVEKTKKAYYYAGLGEGYRGSNRCSDAVGQYIESIKHIQIEGLYVNLTGCLSELGKYKDMEDYSNEGLTIAKNAFIKADLQMHLGLALMNQGKHPKAFSAFAIAKEVYISIPNSQYQGQNQDKNLSLGRVAHNQAQLFLQQSQLDKASQLCSEAYEYYSKQGHENNPNLAEILITQADIQVELGNWKEAEIVYQRADSNKQPHVQGPILTGKSKIALLQKNYSAAYNLSNQALSVQYSKDTQILASVLIGDSLFLRDQYKDAEIHYSKAFEQSKPTGSLSLQAKASLNLCRTQLRLNKLTLAKNNCTLAKDAYQQLENQKLRSETIILLGIIEEKQNGTKAK